MIRRTKLIRISLGDIPQGSTSRRVPEPKTATDHGRYDPKLSRPPPQDFLGDMNTAMFRREQRVSPGVAPRRYYINKYTALFFTELDKGTRSPWVVGAYLICAALACRKMYYLTYGYMYEEREHNATMRPDNAYISNIPFVESHNLAVGLHNKHEHRMHETGNIAGASLTHDAEDKSAVQPPRLIHTEKSEALADPLKSLPADMVLIERREYDREAGRDSIYRMVQYIYDDDVAETGDDAKLLKKLDKDVTAFEKKKYEWLNALPMAKRQARARPDHVHGLVKCRGIDASSNNCVTIQGDAQSETVRKLLLGLGPTHILRDPSDIYARNRLSEFKEPDTNILVMGLRAGELPTAVRQFSNFKIDVVEKDPALVRIARNFLGFKEYATMKLSIDDPLYYVRHLAAEPNHKRYDFVVVDALDGKGRLAPQYSRLEFIDSIRNVMAKAGVVAVNLPNDDAQYYFQCLQNWRMGFENKLLLLAHCKSTQNTVLFAFQDDAERGKPTMGSCGSPYEFADLVKSFITYYRKDYSFNFDLLKEIDPNFFTILSAGQKMELRQVLPPNHPAMRDKKYYAKVSGGIDEGYIGASAFYSENNKSSAYDKGSISNADHNRPAKGADRVY